MISRLRRRLLVGAVGTLASIAGLTGLAFAAGAPQAAHTTSVGTAAEGPLPPFAVEDFTYPNADDILAEHDLVLESGDGHILFAECDGTATQIHVYSREAPDAKYCFRTTAPTGRLTLEVPDVYAIRAGNDPLSADLTAHGETTTVDVTQNEFKPVGEGTTGDPTVLLEIRVTG